MPKLFIGMPVYNGANFIFQAIDSLRNQVFLDWSLFISDNASQDDTERICRHYCEMDSRIQYFRQKHNIGAAANFKFLLDSANSEYFMWAAVDDIWHPDFLESCINNLEKNDKTGIAFCNITNIDSSGQVIRSYPDFSIYATDNRFVNIYRFLFSPEIMGKANLIYSVYRLKLCREIWAASPLTDRWGSDMCFVLGGLARTNLVVDSRTLFQKRIPGTIELLNERNEVTVNNPNRFIFPLENSRKYIKGNLNAVRGTGYYWLTLIVMILRLPNAILNYFRDLLGKLKNKLRGILC